MIVSLDYTPGYANDPMCKLNNKAERYVIDFDAYLLNFDEIGWQILGIWDVASDKEYMITDFDTEEQELIKKSVSIKAESYREELIKQHNDAMEDWYHDWYKEKKSEG